MSDKMCVFKSSGPSAKRCNNCEHLTMPNIKKCEYGAIPNKRGE